MDHSSPTWRFSEDPDQHWTWQRVLPDGTIAQKSQAFAKYGSCISDAIRHGFNPPAQSYTHSRS